MVSNGTLRERSSMDRTHHAKSSGRTDVSNVGWWGEVETPNSCRLKTEFGKQGCGPYFSYLVGKAMTLTKEGLAAVYHDQLFMYTLRYVV